MDPTHKALADHLALDPLVARALKRLKRLGYSRKSLYRYRTIWRRLVAFAKDNDLADGFSEELATRFLDACRQADDQWAKKTKWWPRHVTFAVKVLAEFSRNEHMGRFRTDMQRAAIPPAMKKPLRDYERYCRDRRHLRSSTVKARIGELAKFLDFLGSRDVRRLTQVQPTDLTDYVVSLQHFRPKTVSRMVSNVRLFVQFLAMRGVLEQDPSHVLPRIRVPHDATVPSVWEPELVVKLLEVVDRSSPSGKRDYAMLLLACRLGLRVGDIRTLTLDELDWRASTVNIIQAKTGAPLSLPLSEEVGEALIDYLRFGRPKMEHREVFLVHKPPFGPLRDNHAMHLITKRWRQLAGIRFRGKHRGGFHSLRHTLATRLLAEQTPIHVISGILGHATTTSTLIYAKADTEALRGAALDTEEVHHAE
ncbi:MAG: tyrosine-type recombinase/integrase [bacterium]|nr:tyrosine-type recombinase/integrase [bacterium]MDE0243097.1 tyrosine-type recombinase/integrase [bacterium]